MAFFSNYAFLERFTVDFLLRIFWLTLCSPKMRGWKVIASIILRQRIPILIVVILATAFMWWVRGTERMHDFGKIVPASDPDFIEYQEFREEFGDDGNGMVIGFEGDIFSLKFFNGIYELTEELKKVDGVTSVLSIANASRIIADYETESFMMQKVAERPAADEVEMDSLRQILTALPFYEGLLINKDKTVTLLLVTIDSERLDTEEKSTIVGGISEATSRAEEKIGVEAHLSGLPYIRTFVNKFILEEMLLFLGLAILVMGITLYFTFRSFSAVIFPMLVIGIVITWSVGMMGLMGYKITILTGILPALIAVIGVPNSIYLLTKYHFEFKRTGNKMRALVNVIQKIGIVTVMTNATTAVGFGVLYFTRIQMLKEFGILAALSVVVTFFISLLLIPIIFSFLPPPSQRHVKHTERKMLHGAIKFLDFAVQKRRWAVYAISLLLAVGAILGMTELEPRARVVDDLPNDEKVISDLRFFEKEFGGVMPFEVVVNTHRKQGITRRSTLKRLDQFQTKMAEFPEISRSISILDLIKFGRQAFLSNVPEEYQLPSSEEYLAIQTFTKNSKVDSLFSEATIFDSTFSKVRIKASVQDVGAKRLGPIIDSLEKELVDIFVVNQKPERLKEGEKYKVWEGQDSFQVKYEGEIYEPGDVFTAKDTSVKYEVLHGKGKIDYADKIMITGTTKIFIKSNNYLIRNLFQSLMIAFLVIAVLMAFLFGSLKMVIIALVPNFLPLVLTAGIMGMLSIPIKPSTALIFSVAFGIAVDDTIHYLARYRLARKTGDGVAKAASNSFQDTGVSMIYTSIILFFGFVIFAFSSYGGTVALGQLTSLTLLIALFTNLLLLPSLLISLNKDEEQFADGWIDYEEEQDEVEMIQDFIQGDDG